MATGNFQCPYCFQKGLVNMVKTFCISMSDTITMCENIECLYITPPRKSLRKTQAGSFHPSQNGHSPRKKATLDRPMSELDVTAWLDSFTTSQSAPASTDDDLRDWLNEISVPNNNPSPPTQSPNDVITLIEDMKKITDSKVTMPSSNSKTTNSIPRPSSSCSNSSNHRQATSKRNRSNEGSLCDSDITSVSARYTKMAKLQRGMASQFLLGSGAELSSTNMQDIGSLAAELAKKRLLVRPSCTAVGSRFDGYKSAKKSPQEEGFISDDSGVQSPGSAGSR